MNTALIGLFCGVPSMVGCELVAGVRDGVLEGGASTGSGTAGAGTSAGGGGATGTTSSTGGGTASFSCAPAGGVFDVLTAGDIPGAESATEEFFIIADTVASPPVAHVITRLDQATGTLVARTVKGLSDLGAVTTWAPPPGTTRYVDGYSAKDEVIVLGRTVGMSGQTVTEIHVPKTKDNEIPAAAQVQQVDLTRPDKCAASASIHQLVFSRDSGKTFHAAVWDDCASGERRLYRSTDSGPQLVRTGDDKSASLLLAGYAHAGNQDFMVFSDGKSSGFSHGASIADLQAYEAVKLGTADLPSTAPLAVITTSPNAIATFWAIFGTQSLAPAEVLGRVAGSNDLGTAGEPGGYTTVEKYATNMDVMRWSTFAVGAPGLIVSGSTLDGSSARFSVLSNSGEPLSMDNVVATGVAGTIGNVAAAPFGTDRVLIAWKVVNGSKYTVKGAIYVCQ